MAIKYRVARNSCSHAGIDYNIGDILPDLPIDILNFHLPNLEVVAIIPADFALDDKAFEPGKALKLEEGDQSIVPVDFLLYQELEPGEES